MSECVHNSVQRLATALSIRPPSVGLANSAADVKLRTVKSQKVFSLLHLYLRLTNLFLALSLYVSLSLSICICLAPSFICLVTHKTDHKVRQGKHNNRKPHAICVTQAALLAAVFQVEWVSSVCVCVCSY